MDLVTSVWRRTAGVLWYAVTATVYAPLRWVAGAATAEPIDANWRALMPMDATTVGHPFDATADSTVDFRLWWDALPETSYQIGMEDEDDALSGGLHDRAYSR
ncbi:hypothetical protein pmac_cds_855 [Pandoravirus macleodensis]|uniref:Uncharacterized protein n=1 Tax=Pandoravirus macleodensis TaxID=2107707 RepID=A0A2U7UGB1_9VIRU|nr:hypothetical protein pmac_cds_855 [Pandoravirus macleodensis]AVK77543.1 hypothetical protein pmac_cds_855 [Pandoravirus macleodensis]